MVAAADPAAIDAHQERRLSVLGGEAAGSGRGASLLGTLRAGAGGSGTGTGLLSLRLLPLSAKLAMPVGQQPDFFGADLSATQPLELAGRHAIGPGTAGYQRRLLQGCTDGSPRQGGEQLRRGAPAPSTLLAAKAPARHLHPSEGRGQRAAHRALQAALLGPTVWAAGPLLFPLPDRLLHGLTHRLPAGFLNVLFHLA